MTSSLANSGLSWGTSGSKKSSSSLGDMMQDPDSSDDSSHNNNNSIDGSSSQRNATFTTARTSTTLNSFALSPPSSSNLLYDKNKGISYDPHDHRRNRRASTVLPSSYNPMSTSLHVSRRSSFASHSAHVAQSFLDDDDDQENTSHNTRETFLDEYNNNNNNNEDGRENEMDDFSNTKTLNMWDPEAAKEGIMANISSSNNMSIQCCF